MAIHSQEKSYLCKKLCYGRYCDKALSSNDELKIYTLVPKEKNIKPVNAEHSVAVTKGP